MPVLLPAWVVALKHVAHCIVFLHHQVMQQLHATPQVHAETNQLNACDSHHTDIIISTPSTTGEYQQLSVKTPVQQSGHCL
jgi:hypothetical protein